MSGRFRVGGTTNLGSLRITGSRLDSVALELANLVHNRNFEVALTYMLGLSSNLEDMNNLGM